MIEYMTLIVKSTLLVRPSNVQCTLPVLQAPNLARDWHRDGAGGNIGRLPTFEQPWLAKEATSVEFANGNEINGYSSRRRSIFACRRIAGGQKLIESLGDDSDQFLSRTDTSGRQSEAWSRRQKRVFSQSNRTSQHERCWLVSFCAQRKGLRNCGGRNACELSRRNGYSICAHR